MRKEIHKAMIAFVKIVHLSWLKDGSSALVLKAMAPKNLA